MGITHPSGDQVNYTRDADGRVASVSVTTSGGTTNVVSHVAYEPFGPVSSYTLGNGQAVTRTYDANYRLTDLTSPAFALHVARDAMGHITAIGSAPGANPATESYSYDPLSRLTTVTEANGSVFESATYNSTGDRLTKTGSGLATGAYAYNPGTHQLISTGNSARAVDANGNTTAITEAGSTYGFGFNQRNRMSVAQVNQSTAATYLYDSSGKRIQKTSGGSTTFYNYDAGSHLVGEYGATNREYVWLDDIPVANIDINGTTSTIAYVTADHTGTPRAITDGSGNVLWAWPFEGNAWGELSPVSNGYTYNLRFPGQYYDAETGLFYNGHRDYDPSTGREGESDPTGLLGGLNTYAYGSNNPMSNIDPLGLWVCNGSTAQCNSFSQGLQALQDASDSNNISDYQQQDLQNILNAYGDEGDPNVTIDFGALGPGIKGRTGKNKKGCETITLDSSKLLDPGNEANQWGATIAHEGQHLVDDIEGDATGYPIGVMDSEVNAYTSEAYFDQAQQYPEISGMGNIWTYGGGINWNAIQNRAQWSTNVDTGH